MNTLEFVLDLPSTDQDRYLARLACPANGFWQGDAELRAYIPADRWSASDTEKLKADLAADGYEDALTVRVVESKNWNAVWEDTLSPIRAGPFLVVPASGDPPTGERDAIVLRIDPEMSFGTGHHATTRLALQLLATALDAEDRVLDVGTGTGILAIAACRSGAELALGVDTDENAVRNARENVRRNGVDDCATIEHGSVEAVPDTTYDVVTANITRQVLRSLLPDLQLHLARNGTLILSGILEGKHGPLVETLSAQGLNLEDTATEDGWWAVQFTSAK